LEEKAAKEIAGTTSRIKTKTKKFKDSGNHYTFGGGNIYHDEDGEKTGNGSYVGESIDKWRRKF